MTTRDAPIRVLIADDNRSVRRGLRLQLEAVPDVRVIGEVSNGLDAVAVAGAERADVVLMDLQMPGMTGAAATRELAKLGSIPAVIVMTSFAIDAFVTEALDAGAVGYLLKSHDSDQLVSAIRSAARGESVVSSRVAGTILREFVRRGATNRAEIQDDERTLTAAERRVVSSLASGITSNDALAARLQVSVHTVRSQLQSALKKLDLNDRTQLALWGVRHGLHLEDA